MMDKFMDHKELSNVEQFCLIATRTVANGAIGLSLVSILVSLLIAGGVWLQLAPDREAPPKKPVAETFALSQVSRGDADTLYEEIKKAVAGSSGTSTIPLELAPLFPAPIYTGDNVWQAYCKVASSYGCLQNDRRLVSPSPGSVFAVLMNARSRSYATLGLLSQEEMISVLTQWLPSVDVGDRLKMMAPILISYGAMKKRNQDAVDSYSNEVKAIQARYEIAVAAQNIQSRLTSFAALFWALYSFCCLIGLSGIVALLSMERHLRKS
jgi:hypothetical protein